MLSNISMPTYKTLHKRKRVPVLCTGGHTHTGTLRIAIPYPRQLPQTPNTCYMLGIIKKSYRSRTFLLYLVNL